MHRPPGSSRALTSLGLTRLDYHIASHYDDDHIGCTDHVLARWPVEIASYDRGTLETPATQTYSRYAAAVASTRYTLTIGSVIVLDDTSSAPVKLWVVTHDAGGRDVSSENDRSVVLVVRFGAFDAELGGDLPGFAVSDHLDLETAVGRDIGQVELYKVHQHGSASSSNSTFLGTIRPRVAVLSMGSPNAFGHPAQAALDRLRAAGTVTWWTTPGDGAPPVAPYDIVANDTISVDVAYPGVSFTMRTTGGSVSVPSVVWCLHVRGFADGEGVHRRRRVRVGRRHHSTGLSLDSDQPCGLRDNHRRSRRSGKWSGVVHRPAVYRHLGA